MQTWPFEEPVGGIATRYASTSLTSLAPSPFRKSNVCRRSNFASVASIVRKKPSSLAAFANRGTLNTGWYGIGRPLSKTQLKTAVNDASRIVTSKVTGMNDGQLFSGRPPTFIG